MRSRLIRLITVFAFLCCCFRLHAQQKLPPIGNSGSPMFSTPGELFSTERPITLQSRTKGKPKEQEGETTRHGLTHNGLSGLLFTETTEKFPPHELVFATHYLYTPIQYRWDQRFSESETGTIQTLQASVMYPTDVGEIAVTVPFHYFELSAPRLFGQPAHEQSGLGDVKIAAKGIWWPPGRYYRFGGGVVVDFPSGQKRSLRPVGVNGEETARFFLNAGSKESEDLRAHAQIGYAFNEDTFDVFYYNVAFDYRLSKQTTFLAEFLGSEGGENYGSNLDFAPSVRVAFGERFSGTLGLVFSLFNEREFGYDYKMVMSSMYRW